MTHRQYLQSLELFGIKLGLDKTRTLLAGNGNPQDRVPMVHVGGTNGKGSVVAMLDAILRCAGYDTGRFTSPHLIRVNERFIVNSDPIDDETLDRYIAMYRRVAEGMETSPTFFEMNAAIAFEFFAEREVDAALVEVGMGGRFDATNVISPVATAITNIDLEHTQYLGDTLEKVASEKAGIIKPGVPLVLGETRPGPRDVILGRAAEQGAPVMLLGREFHCGIGGPAFAGRFSYEDSGLSINEVQLGLKGQYQGVNAGLATALARLLADRFPRLDETAMREGLSRAHWPCRMEEVLSDPPVIIDVAHNAAGAQRLAEEVPRCVLLLAVSADKDAQKMITALAPLASRLILSQFSGNRAMPVERLAELAEPHPHISVPSLEAAVDKGLALASATCPLVITGSIFTAGEARDILVRGHGAAPVSFAPRGFG